MDKEKITLGEEDEEMYQNILRFAKQAFTTDQKYATYKKQYLGAKVDIHFGYGNKIENPYIAFLLRENKVSNGIYPVLAVHPNLGIMDITYCTSDEKKPTYEWPEKFKGQLMSDYMEKKYNYKSTKEHRGIYFYKEYEVDDIPRSIIIDIKEIIAQYREVVEEATGR